MDDSQVFKQLEFYSNAIVAFIVIQSLTFCFNFGTSVNFNNILRTNQVLSISLAVAMLIVMLLSLYAIHFLGSRLQQLSVKHQETIKTIYRGKAVAVVVFSVIQICVTIVYAVFSPISNIMP